MPDKAKEIVILSGKGGTGKTTVTAALAHLAGDKVICDLDVDAPDLHLLLTPEPRLTEEFYSGNEAIINPEACEGCGLCLEKCRFGAVVQDNETFTIDPLKCEGCKVCVALCPAEAIDFPERHCGQWHVSETRFGTMVHAQLFPGQENSGLLVSLLRAKAREIAEEKGLGLILSDGSPGIGCPVISSLTGASLAVVVTEPTPSGRHDLLRAVELAEHFRIPAGVIINKADLNPAVAGEIEAEAKERDLPVLARLAYDRVVVEAMINRQTVTEYGTNGLAENIRRAWSAIVDLAGLNQPGQRARF